MQNVISSFDSLSFGEYQIDSTYINDLYLDEENDDRLYMKQDLQNNISRFIIQGIITGEIKNESFYLEYFREDQDISVYSIKSSQMSNGSLRPMLIIKYYLHDKTRI